MALRGKEKVEDLVVASTFGTCFLWLLEKLFPSLFAKLDIACFHCEVCELAKRHRVAFSLVLHKSPTPFLAIHSNVRGPSKIATIGRSHWFVYFY